MIVIITLWRLEESLFVFRQINQTMTHELGARRENIIQMGLKH